MFTKILAWIRGVINRMIGQSTVQKALNVDIAISAPMADALQVWSDMYNNNASWLDDDTKSLNLPATIAGEIARAVTIEMKVTVSGSPRAAFLQAQVDKLLPKLREQVEKGAAKGGLMLKPYVEGKTLAVDFVQADMFYPVAFDADGDITACVFADQRQIGKKFYTRLEFHRMNGNTCQITNQAFASDNPQNLGQQVALDSVPEWADILPSATVYDIQRPLYAYFRYPLANNIDATSPLGVSCYSRAVELIEQADKQWSGLLWEFESGNRALYVDATAFKKDSEGNPILPNKRLYRTLNGSGNMADEDLFHEWTPTLREANFLAGLDAILRKIEFACGLAYGTLSNPQSVDKTATELKISQQRSYATVTDTQKALENALDGLLYAMDVWTTTNRLAPTGKYAAVYDFDDSVIVDKDTQFKQDLQLVSGSIMSKLEFRMRNFGEDEATARRQLDLISEEEQAQMIVNGDANPYASAQA